MSTALVPFISGAELTDFRNASALMAQSEGLRSCFVAKPANVLIALLIGRDMGIPATLALTRGFVIKGKFDLDTEVKLYIVMERMPDFEYEVLELDDEHCVARGGLKGKQSHTATFTKKQALAAGLDGYTGPYAQDKLLWRCIGRIIKFTGAGRSMIFSHPALREEEDGPTLNSPGAHPASGAEVLEDGPPGHTGRPVEGRASPVPVQPANDERKAKMDGYDRMFAEGEAAKPPASQPVPDDDLGDLLRAVAAHYGHTSPGTHKNAYTKWIKANAESLGKIVALYYGEKAQEVPAKWNMVPPSDYRPIAEWLIGKDSKRAGAGAATPGEPDVAPALDSVGAGDAGSGSEAPAGSEGSSNPAPIQSPADAEPPAEPEDTFGGPEALARKDLGHMLGVLTAMAHAAKDDQRSFVYKSPKGNWALIDAKILRALGSVNDRDAVVSVWLKDWEADPVKWRMLCDQVADEATLLGVSYLD